MQRRLKSVDTGAGRLTIAVLLILLLGFSVGYLFISIMVWLLLEQSPLPQWTGYFLMPLFMVAAVYVIGLVDYHLYGKEDRAHQEKPIGEPVGTRSVSLKAP